MKHSMKQIFTTLTSLILSLTVFGQHDFGLKVNGGLSYLSTNFQSSFPQAQKFYFMPSGHGGLFYNFHLSDNAIIGTELLIAQIEGKEFLSYEVMVQPGLLSGQFVTSNFWRHISYLGFPIYYGFNFKNLNVNLGFQANLMLASSGHEITQGPYNGKTRTWEYKSSKLGIDNYDYGARAGILLYLTKKFSIEANYYYGLNNILKDTKASSVWTWKVQQATVGIRYKFKSIGGHLK